MLLQSPLHTQPIGVVGDFKDTKATSERLISKTIEAYGKLDILVNNAGLFKPISFESTEAYDCFEDLIKINLNSAVQLTHLAVPYLKSSKGCVVNISSNLHSKCIGGGFAYCTAKAALVMFTKCIAVDLAPEVRVNSVSPGPIATLMSTRCGVEVDKFRETVGSACLTNRIGEPDEVARVVTFLVSPESSFITGSDFVIDGGCTIKPFVKAMGQD